MLQLARGCDIYGDKGFIGQDGRREASPLGQEEITCSTGNHIWTIQRCNQDHQAFSTLKRLLGRIRQRIEGVFHEIQQVDCTWRGNLTVPRLQITGRNPERLLNKTV